MKKRVKLLSLVVGLVLVSCNQAERDEQSFEVGKTGNSKSIITSFSKSSNTISKGDSGLVVFTDIQSSNEQLNEKFEGLVVKVDLNSNKAIFTHESEEGSLEFNLIKSDNDILYLDLYNEVVPTSLTSKKIPKWLCGAKCVGEGFLISLWDGPAPLMDIAAASYTLACSLDCR